MAACKHRFHSRESMNGRMQLACFSTVKTCMVSKCSYAHTEDNDYWSLRSFKGARLILEEKHKTLVCLRIEDRGSILLEE